MVNAVVALDDDPTGPQALAGVRVLLAWSPGRVASALEGRRAVHLLTNARALPPTQVSGVVASAARAARDGAPDAHVILRGDSTLRGHLREELLGLYHVIDGADRAPVLLVPTLPAAGRVTIGGVHLAERDCRRVPLHETEYARDGIFSYANARLVAWADERTGGLLPASAGRELHLDDLRSRGANRVAEIICELCAAGRPAAFAPDAETNDDLCLIAEGYARAHEAGSRALVRCAPAFVGVLSGTTAAGYVPAPRANDRLLVICGSYVPTATRQLGRLLEEHPSALVEADVAALALGDQQAEVVRVAREVARLLEEERLAVVATPRERPIGTRSLEAGDRIAKGIAAVVRAIDPRPGVIVAKGGITSHVTLQVGLGANEAEVVGPVLPGVSHWRIAVDGGNVDYLVVPGNVGDDNLLATLVERLLCERGSSQC